jgi:hypothetical protein
MKLREARLGTATIRKAAMMVLLMGETYETHQLGLGWYKG